MQNIVKRPMLYVLSIAGALAASGGVMALDVEKAHQSAIKNCVNWNGESVDYCSCVQNKIRTDLPKESYEAMLEFAQAYQEDRRADLAAMQVDTRLSKALEPVNDATAAAEQACRT